MKVDADDVRTGLHRDARAQALVERLFRQRQVRVRQLVVVLAADRRGEHALAVDADLELVRPLEPGHVADDVLQQVDAEVVVGIEREVVVDDDAAARAERQPFDVIALRAIGRHPVHRARPARRVGSPTASAGDLARRRQVLFEQRRRHLQHVRDVVEPVRLVVGRQESGRVDLEREQIADRVGVLGAVQAVKRRPAGVGFRERRAIDRSFRETRRTPSMRRLVGPRRAERGHHARRAACARLFPRSPRLPGTLVEVASCRASGRRSCARSLWQVTQYWSTRRAAGACAERAGWTGAGAGRWVRQALRLQRFCAAYSAEPAARGPTSATPASRGTRRRRHSPQLDFHSQCSQILPRGSRLSVRLRPSSTMLP